MTGDAYERPDDASDQTVAAAGKVSEAFEWLERARGRLYDFHQMLGHLDLKMSEAADLLRQAGHEELAAVVDTDVVGRNVLDGRWTFQVVEEFDDLYYESIRAIERRIREELVGGRRHLHEAAIKEQRRTLGVPGHESRPPAAHHSRPPAAHHPRIATTQARARDER